LIYIERILCFWEKSMGPQNASLIFLLKCFFKNVMEYALPETTIGAKWKCVWNGLLNMLLKSDSIFFIINTFRVQMPLYQNSVLKTYLTKQDKEIDALVYELYGLSNEEIKIVKEG
jgi:hypothetical protein